MNTKYFVSLVLVLSFLCLFQGGVYAKQTKLKMRIVAQNDIPGPVNIKITGHDSMGKKILQKTLSWNRNDNRFSIKTLPIPAELEILRFTFVNDNVGTRGHADDERDAFIDYFTINNHRYEAEDYAVTGGPDPRFGGCNSRRFPGRSVVDCDNQGDYIEFKVSLKSGKHKHKLEISARDDRPAPVEIEITGRDYSGKIVTRKILSWGENTDKFAIQAMIIPTNIKNLRFTFNNDSVIKSDQEEKDRNAYIDFFMVDQSRYEAEKFDRTGGTGARAQGCEAKSVDGRIAVECGKQGDWVEYHIRLHPAGLE